MTASSGRGGSLAAQSPLDAPDVQDVFKGRTLGVALVGKVGVVVHSAQPPDPAEWLRYCELISTHHSTISAQFVMAEGPGPNATQRQQALLRTPKGFVIPPTAVLTRSAMVRGIVTLFNWFTPRAMKAFPPEEFAAAAQHMKLTEEQMQRLLEVARALLPETP